MKKKIGDVDSFVVPRKDFESIMRLISSIVVSKDQIGSCRHMVDSDEEHMKLLWNYSIDWSVTVALAHARRIMMEIYDREFTS